MHSLPITRCIVMSAHLLTEEQLFSELEALCTSPGYIHALAYLCVQDRLVSGGQDSVTPNDISHQKSGLLGNEINLLIALMCRKPIDTYLFLENIKKHCTETRKLLGKLCSELNDSRSAVLSENIEQWYSRKPTIRCSAFYSCDSAYGFQYKDFSVERYKKDNDWLIKNKGLAIEQAQKVVAAIGNNLIGKFNVIDPLETPLEYFTFTIDDLCRQIADIDKKTITAVIDAFTLPKDNSDIRSFSKLDDFNPVKAFPILKVHEKEQTFVSFDPNTLAQALYENPPFWFREDPTYKAIAENNRGCFTEDFSTERLSKVFGAESIFKNVDIYHSEKPNNKEGEIDVLVTFADRAVIIQAKSKTLTLKARQGDSEALKNDFKKTVEDAYKQGVECGGFLRGKSYKLFVNDKEIPLNQTFKKIYLFCVIADDYPSLAFQSFISLDTANHKDEVIQKPFIMDVFLLDVMAEMLESPLHFLNYVDLRVGYDKKILANHELNILAHHLKQNLWIDDYDYYVIDDRACSKLDLAMLTRREKSYQETSTIDTPPGILTLYKDTFFGRLIRGIEKEKKPEIIDLGFTLLRFGSETIEKINNVVSRLCASYRQSGKVACETIFYSEISLGITFDCCSKETHEPKSLEVICYKRKYENKAGKWFGIVIDAKGEDSVYILGLTHKWKQSDKMERSLREIKKMQRPSTKKVKIGRNSLCPCESGKKYKKCCLP